MRRADRKSSIRSLKQDRISQSKAKIRRRLLAELLEERAMLAVLSYDDTTKTLSLTAETGDKDTVTVNSADGLTYTVEDTAGFSKLDGFAGTNCSATLDGTSTIATVTCAATTDLTSLLIDLGDMDDVINVQSSKDPITISGGNGSDKINLGNASNSLDEIDGEISVEGDA
ncbi:MAG: hypothetical protein RIS70_1395, partial [Planctomycetota bacterium]